MIFESIAFRLGTLLSNLEKFTLKHNYLKTFHPKKKHFHPTLLSSKTISSKTKNKDTQHIVVQNWSHPVTLLSSEISCPP